MHDIGIVQYSKSNVPGTLDAEWYYWKDSRTKVSGTGTAQGKSTSGFAGDFHVRYFDDTGIETADFHLEIRETGNCFYLRWLKNGHEEYFGTGIELSGKLIAGWRKK